MSSATYSPAAPGSAFAEQDAMSPQSSGGVSDGGHENGPVRASPAHLGDPLPNFSPLSQSPSPDHQKLYQSPKKRRFSFSPGAPLRSENEGAPFVALSGAAQVFLGGVAAFAVVTTIFLVALEIIQADHAHFLPNALLQPLTMLAEVFLVLSAYVAVRSQNLVLIIAVVLFNVYLVVGGFIEVTQRVQVLNRDEGHNQKSHAIRGILWTIPSLDAAFHVVVDWAAWKLYREYGWLAYRRASADVALRKLYQRYLVLSTLLMFAVFFATAQAYILGVTRAKIALAVLHQNPSYWIVGHALSWLVYTAAALLAWVATTRESGTLMIVSAFGQLAYLGWSIRVIVDFAHTLWPWFTAHEATMIVMYRQSFMPHRTLFQIIIAHLVFVATFIYCILVGMRFGRGLSNIRTARPTVEREAAGMDLSLE